MNDRTTEPPPGPPAGRPTGHRAPRRTGAAWRSRLAATRRPFRGRHGSRSSLWRLCAPIAFLLAGALFVTSATSADGIDLRSGRFSDLSGLVRREAEGVEELRAKQTELAEEVESLSKAEGTEMVTEVQEQVDALAQPAGMLAVEGPGLTVTLTDAPDAFVDQLDGTTVDLDALVVHQQDIQAVANAMWAGGAEAMTIQGQRVISTTGIKCVGNTVILHGVPYAPPYVLRAVGDPDAMLTSINTNGYIERYRKVAEAGGLGYDLDVETELNLPAYEGSVDLRYARVAGGENSARDSDI